MRLSPHPFWEFTCVASGEGWLLHKEGRTRLRPDAVLLVPPGCGHGEHSDVPMDTIWVRVEGQRMRSVKLTRVTAVQSAALRIAFEELWLLTEHGGNRPIGAELDGRLAVIVSRFFRLVEGHEEQAHGDLAERAVVHMTEHMAESIKVSDMAERFNCSEGYLHRAFKRHTGLTPIAYLTQARCRQAADLLNHTDWSIAAVADAVGFNDAFYFSRVFRGHYGTSPRQYRKVRRQTDGRPHDPGPRAAGASR
jgi:AraC-like DNA-binding protein